MTRSDPKNQREQMGTARRSAYNRGMRRLVLLGVPMLLLLSFTARPAQLRADEDLVPGARAPEFELPGSDGKTYALSQFAGKRGVVLAWFPKAFTPG